MAGRRNVALALALLIGVLPAACSSPRQTPARSPVVPATRPADVYPPATASPVASGSSPAAQWPGYHADQSRSGSVAAQASSGIARPAWSVDLGGAVRGQPVIGGGIVIAVTETNRVVSLNPADGAILWSASVGPPLTNVAAIAGCGDIDPLGITSTPVIDPRSGTVYVVAEVDEAGVVRHRLEGLTLTSGAVVLSETVDPPLPAGERAVNLLQRASLALAGGRIYISYGGNDGDCGSYHGWVVGVREVGPPQMVSFEVAADGEGGAIWQAGGAPAIDAAGNLYVSTGNANPDPPQGGPDPKKYTESVVKLSPDLRPLASFKDTVAGGDEDLSTANPVLLPDHRVFAVGKTDIGFLLRQDTLGQVTAIPGICGSDPDGGPAYDSATNRMYVACRGGGIDVVNLTTGKVGPKLSGADSAPILVGTNLWAANTPDGTLREFDTTTGAPVQTLQVGPGIPLFNTPTAGLGLLLIGTSTGVAAFR